jgi:hypothetical protein
MIVLSTTEVVKPRLCTCDVALLMTILVVIVCIDFIQAHMTMDNVV